MARVGTTPAAADARAWTALLALAAATAGVSLALASGPGVAAGRRRLSARRRPSAQVPLPKIRKAITCLVNDRAREARPPPARAQREAGARRPAPQPRTMLAKDCFRHRLPGRAGPHRPGQEDRLHRRASGLAVRREPGLREHPAPDDRALAALAASTAATCSTADFRDIGVGVGWGAPVAGRDDSEFATYTIVFGWRRPRR